MLLSCLHSYLKLFCAFPWPSFLNTLYSHQLSLDCVYMVNKMKGKAIIVPITAIAHYNRAVKMEVYLFFENVGFWHNRWKLNKCQGSVWSHTFFHYSIFWLAKLQKSSLYNLFLSTQFSALNSQTRKEAQVPSRFVDSLDTNLESGQ